MTLMEAAIWLGEKQLELYRDAPDVYISAFTEGSCNRAIIHQFYNCAVRLDKIRSLEKMDEAYKTELKKMAIDFSAGKLDKTGCLDMAKLLHLIAQYV